ncbi:MAG TPA: MAPEG family protein [Steroidobacteraceae bacterium]|nr:MAPEG family protein [Steroidobacteraceae bacterium]
MRNLDILYPLFALGAWTLLVLLLIPFVRVRSVLRREIGPNDFRFGESSAVPPKVSIPNRNYMNLLELPMLFYVVCVVLYVTGGASRLSVLLAWAYVGLRVVHSVIHLTYNHVLHRLFAFTLSNVALVSLWVIAGAHVASSGTG